jgi:hypothetical protein
VGPLKWGVGKLIANASALPTVVPIFHWGMGDLLPQTRTNDFLTLVPSLGANALVSVAVGAPVPVADLLQAYHRSARRRAVARNAVRLRDYRAELARSGVRGAAAAALLAPFEAQQARWAAATAAEDRALAAANAGGAARAAAAGGGGGAGGAGGGGGGGWAAWFGAAPAPAPAAARSPPAAPPVNTVDEVSDHTGASARVAGVAQLLSPAVRADGASPAPAPAHWPALHAFEAALATRAASLEARAAALAAEVAAEVAASAAELARRLRELQGGGDAPPAKAPPPPPPAAPAPPPPAAPAPPPPASTLPQLARAALDEAVARWQKSVSVPAPATPPALPPLGLSDEPVLERVPARVLRTGVAVPAFVEAPLRAKPPDHPWLSPADARAEEDARLQLYSDLAARLEAALAELEVGVMARRAARGHVESRPMESVRYRMGPPGAPPALPGLPDADK